MTFSHPWLDLSAPPLVVLRYPDTRELELLQEYFDAEIRFYEQCDRRVVWVVDTTEMDPVMSGPLIRKQYAEHQKRVREHEERWVIAAAVVAPSGLMRGVITALNWLTSPPYAVQSFATIEEAKVWGREQWALEARGETDADADAG